VIDELIKASRKPGDKKKGKKGPKKPMGGQQKNPNQVQYLK
jgi:hypothetical protein